jgi:hypothetical protein
MILLLLGIISLGIHATVIPVASPALSINSANGAVSHNLISRLNDVRREKPRLIPENQARVRHILDAFYRETNMHSEVFSKFKALLKKMNEWMDGQEGYSLSGIQQLMDICREAAMDLDKMKDYHCSREGKNARETPLELIPVLPAILATIGVPQRHAVTEQLMTIAPKHSALIEQWAEHLRLFIGRPWKKLEDKKFASIREGPLKEIIIAALSEAQKGCRTAYVPSDVDMVIEGIGESLRAALVWAPCSTNQHSEPFIEDFAKRAASISIPKVRMEIVRPLTDMRDSVVWFMRQLPSNVGLMEVVTRGVNEKRSVREIAALTVQHWRDYLGGTLETLVFLPVVLTPLALITSLKEVLEQDQIVMPRAPAAYRILILALYAALQGGSDYVKLSEQIEGELAMYHLPDQMSAIIFNLVKYYDDAFRVEGAVEEPFRTPVLRALRKAYKAVSWNGPLPSSKKGEGKTTVDLLASLFYGFHQDCTKPSPHIKDYWHALKNYGLPAYIPFSYGQAVGNNANTVNASNTDTLKTTNSAPTQTYPGYRPIQGNIGSQYSYQQASQPLSIPQGTNTGQTSMDSSNMNSPVSSTTHSTGQAVNQQQQPSYQLPLLSHQLSSVTLSALQAAWSLLNHTASLGSQPRHLQILAYEQIKLLMLCPDNGECSFMGAEGRYDGAYLMELLSKEPCNDKAEILKSVLADPGIVQLLISRIPDFPEIKTAAVQPILQPANSRDAHISARFPKYAFIDNIMKNLRHSSSADYAAASLHFAQEVVSGQFVMNAELHLPTAIMQLFLLAGANERDQIMMALAAEADPLSIVKSIRPAHSLPDYHMHPPEDLIQQVAAQAPHNLDDVSFDNAVYHGSSVMRKLRDDIVSELKSRK